jgi:hypothetical protein
MGDMLKLICWIVIGFFRSRVSREAEVLTLRHQLNVLQRKAAKRLALTAQLQRYYHSSWETFLGKAGLIQCFAKGDQSTLDYIARRLERLVAPFELRTAFSPQRISQLLMIEGEAPAAAIRLEHENVVAIRARIAERGRTTGRFRPSP